MRILVTYGDGRKLDGTFVSLAQVNLRWMAEEEDQLRRNHVQEYDGHGEDHNNPDDPENKQKTTPD